MLQALHCRCVHHCLNLCGGLFDSLFSDEVCNQTSQNAVDADSKESHTLGGIQVNGNLDRDEPPRKQLRRTLPAWFEKNQPRVPKSESLLITRRFITAKGDAGPVDGLQTSLVQTNLSQLTCTWPMSHSAYQGIGSSI